MKIRTNLYPEGKKRAITMSYDDAPPADRELIPIFNAYGFKGTFHANSMKFGEGKVFTDKEARELYRGHELSVHTLSHPCMLNDLKPELYDEIMLDKKRIEEVCGYTVRGMSYPYGQYSRDVIEVARMCGMKYSRTTRSTGDFRLPENFMEWHPTTHHNGNLTELLEKFMASRMDWVYNMPCFYIWGHSYEFDKEHNDNLYIMEEFCKKAANLPDTWYATNIEIYDYVTAAASLDISAERKYIFNPSRLSVWVTVDNTRVVEVKPGENAL